MDTKICNSCGEEKVLSAFHPHKGCKGGVTGTCRVCRLAQNREWQRNNRARRQAYANERNRKRKAEAVAMFNGKCLDCGQAFPDCVFEFHHTDPSQKDINPSEAWARPKWMEELNKCVMLCANCHRIRHMEMRNESTD